MSLLGFMLIYFVSCVLDFTFLASSSSIIHFPKGLHSLCPKHSEASLWVEAPSITKKSQDPTHARRGEKPLQVATITEEADATAQRRVCISLLL